MADDADTAAMLQDAYLAASLRAIDATLPAGVAGECEECGEQMPRLIGGRCAFCRDGRRPPLSFYADRETPAAPASTTKEYVKMAPETTPATSRKIEFTGVALAAIEARAEADDVSYKQAATELIGIALASVTAPTEPASGFDGSKPSAVVFLGNVPDNWLVEELTRRMNAGVGSDEHEAAMARAEVAETQLAAIRQQLGALANGVPA